jgi:hypothetical protein
VLCVGQPSKTNNRAYISVSSEFTKQPNVTQLKYLCQRNNSSQKIRSKR